MTEIQGKSILVRVSEGSSYRESTVLWLYSLQELTLLFDSLIMSLFSHAIEVWTCAYDSLTYNNYSPKWKVANQSAQKKHFPLF